MVVRFYRWVLCRLICIFGVMCWQLNVVFSWLVEVKNIWLCMWQICVFLVFLCCIFSMWLILWVKNSVDSSMLLSMFLVRLWVVMVIIMVSNIMVEELCGCVCRLCSECQLKVLMLIMIIIVISVVIGICCIRLLLYIISISSSMLVIRQDRWSWLLDVMFMIDWLIIVQLVMLLRKLVIVLVMFWLMYLWLCLLGVLVMFLMICRVIIDLSRLIMVSVVDIGSRMCSVFQLSGILGMRNCGRLFGSWFMLLILCMFMLKLIIMVVSMMIVISGEGIVWVRCGSRQMIVSVVVYSMQMVGSWLISFGICVRKIRIVNVLMKLVMIECEMNCISDLSLNIFVSICSRLVRMLVVNRYCRLWFLIRLIIISVIVLVVVEIMFGWLLVMVVVIVMENVVYRLILGLMLVMSEKVMVLGIRVRVMIMLDSRLLWMLLSYCWCRGQDVCMEKFCVYVGVVVRCCSGKIWVFELGGLVVEVW